MNRSRRITMQLQAKGSGLMSVGARRGRRVGVSALSVLVLVGALFASNADANLEFSTVGLSITGQDGLFSRQAGAHPDLDFNFSLPVDTTTPNDGSVVPGPPEAVRDVELEMPPGFVGNVSRQPSCPQPRLVNNDLGYPNCPPGTQVGSIHLYLAGVPQEPIVGVYNLAHGPEVPAEFGFQYLGAIATITVTVRPGDHGITSGSLRIPQALPLQGAELSIWGVPADPSHEALREVPTTGSPATPFLRSPTACAEGGTTFTARGDSWEFPGVFESRVLSTDEAGTPLAFEGCERLPFAPRLSVTPTSRSAASPTGMRVDFFVPQNEGAHGLSTSDVRSVSVTLPQGMSVSASSAGGLGACSQAAIGIDSNEAPNCPESSKIGTVSVVTPLLSEGLAGDVYLAKQRENPFGSLLALYMVIRGPGFYLKLAGRVDADPQTGQLTVSFDDTPQLPFEELQMEFKSGPRAPLTLPKACGNYGVKSEIAPWSGTDPIKAESTFRVTEGCATDGFSPGFRAGTSNPTGGSFSPFTLQVTRNDGESNLSRIQATLPPGLLAKLAGVPLCGDAQAASGDCPAASQVGTTTVGAGAGSNPIYVPEAGKAPTAVYLAGPYKGAPYSLVVKVPAQAGPFDLGTVVVRNALQIDPTTTQVTAESDPLPQILEGIPVTYRDVRVEVNRPEFTVNPTNCSQFQVTSLLTSAAGQTATPKAPFAAANCERLGFKPSLALRLDGAPTRRGASPALTATLKPLKGDANLAKAAVVLPATELLEQGHIRTTCTRVQFAASSCPKGSIYGKAKAWTPLLDKPLEGSVYLRSNGGERQLPDLVADLGGQIHVVLVGYIDSVKRNGSPRIRTRFVSVPDAPVSKFELKMAAGKKSLLVNNTNLCKAKPHAEAVLNGQNGKEQKTQPAVSVGGCGGAKKKSKKSK